MSSTRENPVTKSPHRQVQRSQDQRSPSTQALPPEKAGATKINGTHLLKWLAASLLLLTFVLVPPASRPLPFSPCMPLATLLRLASRSSNPHAPLACKLPPVRLSRSETHVCKSCLGQLSDNYLLVTGEPEP